MGGSSLCAEVLAWSLGPNDGCPTLRVLDSTDPAQIRSCEEQIALDRTLFLTSSKSGSTLESSILLQYFLDRVQQTVGLETAGARFVAITDPGSPLETVATKHRFRAVFNGVPDIGGRFSALTVFGTVPAAAMGIDVEKLRARADEMRARSAASVPVRENPGVMLGLVLGVLARSGRDKVTFVASPSIAPLGAWVEQLLAESTGKQGHGLIPVDGETLASPERYRADRVFVYLRDEMAPDHEQESALTRIEDAGQPVIKLVLRDPYDVGAEFFRWEFATAVLGAELGINPFDQPDVEASKLESRRLTAEYETTGSVPRGAVVARNETVQVLGDTPSSQSPREGAKATSTRWSPPIWAGCDLVTIWPCWPTSSGTLATRRRFRGCDTRFETRPVMRPVSDLVRDSSTPPGRSTREAPTPACFCRSPAMTSPIFPSGDSGIRLVW